MAHCCHNGRFELALRDECRRNPACSRDLYGAGDGDRTHDIQLGKLTLYQLSYARSRFAARGREVGRTG